MMDPPRIWLVRDVTLLVASRGVAILLEHGRGVGGGFAVGPACLWEPLDP